MKPSVGLFGWVIAPSVEAANYEDNEPRQPWPVVVAEILDDKLIKVHYRSENGNIDDDTNATAYVNPEEFYQEFAVAKDAYVLEMSRWLAFEQGRLADKHTTLISFMERHCFR
jgi:hypothetical protein